MAEFVPFEGLVLFPTAPLNICLLMCGWFGFYPYILTYDVPPGDSVCWLWSPSCYLWLLSCFICCIWESIYSWLIGWLFKFAIASCYGSSLPLWEMISCCLLYKVGRQDLTPPFCIISFCCPWFELEFDFPLALIYLFDDSKLLICFVPAILTLSVCPAGPLGAMFYYCMLK